MDFQARQADCEYIVVGSGAGGGTAGRRARGEPAEAAHEYRAEPRFSIFSIAAPTPPSEAIIWRITRTSAGMAQKSPHTHRMAAPICWSRSKPSPCFGGSPASSVVR